MHFAYVPNNELIDGSGDFARLSIFHVANVG
jgi:hypothetical protein